MLQLPYSVVQHIVAFAAVDNYRNPGAVICTTVKRTLNQLLNTSSSFRAAALDQLNCDMSISQKHEMLIFSKLACGTAEGEGVLEYKHVFDCVKTVDMMVDVSSLFFQDMLVNESEDFIRELVFPNVHTLELQIASTIGYDLSDIVENEEYKYADEETLEKKYKDNVSKFVLYAKNMLPNVRFFNLIMGGIAHTYSDEFPDIVDLVFEQFSGVRSPSLTVNSKIYNYDVNTPLGSLSIVWKEFSDGPKELVARHADTLQHLKVVLLSSNSGFSEFVAKERIIFPVLQKLHLGIVGNIILFDMDPVDVDPEYVPFPSLCKLLTSGRYSLTEEHYLRGNEKTLRLLDIYVDNRVIKTLANVFTGDRCQKNLVCFKFYRDMEWFTEDMTSYIDDQKYSGLFRLLQKSLMSIKLAKKPQVQEDINWDVFANFSSLRVIELPDICIDLTAVCKLLSHVRCLRDLGAGNFELGSRFSHMSFPDIINTLQLESNPLNRHLNTLRVMDRYMFGYHSQSTGKETAMFAAALMQVCPSLNPVKIYGSHIRTVNAWYKILNRTLARMEGCRQVNEK